MELDGNHLAIAVLIATRDRDPLLFGRSLPSVARQERTPDRIVIVNDGAPWNQAQKATIISQAGDAPTALLKNRRTRGAAGAWNTGLAHLLASGHRGFIAMLDDDDEWDSDHLAINEEYAIRFGASIVVSGLRLRRVSQDLKRPLVSRLIDRDFLVGNPGWQGSNTFVDLGLLPRVGGFRESLQSLHDRDLAIRLLRLPDASPSLAPRWTATWHVGHTGQLSAYRGLAKQSGLRRFWQIYGSQMTDDERSLFLERAHRLFGFEPYEIVADGGDAQVSYSMTGDLDAVTSKQL